MKKKSKKKGGVRLADLSIVLLSAVALVMIFLPAVSFTLLKEKSTYSGLQVVFGYSEETNLLVSTLKTEIFKFSFMNLLTYLFVLGALVFGVLRIVKKKTGFLFLATACALLAGIFFLLTPSFVVLPEAIENSFAALNTTFAEEAKLAVGSILGAVCSFAATACGAAMLVLDN